MILEKLEKARPSDVAYRRELAISHLRLGSAHAACGDICAQSTIRDGLSRSMVLFPSKPPVIFLTWRVVMPHSHASPRAGTRGSRP